MGERSSRVDYSADMRAEDCASGTLPGTLCVKYQWENLVKTPVIPAPTHKATSHLGIIAKLAERYGTTLRKLMP